MNPEDGICTCGYGLELSRKGDYSQTYSKELSEKLGANAVSEEEVEELFRALKRGFKAEGGLDRTAVETMDWEGGGRE